MQGYKLAESSLHEFCHENSPVNFGKVVKLISCIRIMPGFHLSSAMSLWF